MKDLFGEEVLQKQKQKVVKEKKKRKSSIEGVDITKIGLSGMEKKGVYWEGMHRSPLWKEAVDIPATPKQYSFESKLIEDERDEKTVWYDR